jgi:hypothetical protein
MILRSAVTAATFAIVYSMITGCSSAPGSESSGSTDEALPKCTDGICPAPYPTIRQLPPPPPPTNTCSFDGISRAANTPGATYHDPSWYPHGYQAHLGSTFCVSNSATDAMSVTYRWLMNNGCSQPFYWEAYNRDGGWSTTISASDLAACQTTSTPAWSCFTDKANAYIQLCPNNATIGNYVNGSAPMQDNNCSYSASGGLGCMSHSGHVSDLRAHGPMLGLYDTVIPSPPAGYGWVVVWEDPVGCQGGCMCTI